MSSCSVRLISPFGPFTVILCPSICAVTPLGNGTGFLPMRDIVRSYHTTASTSPPTRAVRASRSVMRPCGVLRIAMPRPFLMRGISRAFT